MSKRLPRLTAPEVVRALERAGFVLVRQTGSHRIYRNAEGRRVTVPVHPGKVLHPKLLWRILKDAGLTVEDVKEGR